MKITKLSTNESKPATGFPFMSVIYLILILFCVPKANFCQQLTYKGLGIDTIVITSSSGHYNFDEKGTSSSTSNSYRISFDNTRNKYVATGYEVGTVESSFKIKKRHIKIGNDGSVSRASLVDLLASFDTAYSIPTFEVTDIGQKKFHSLTSEKHVRKVAKTYRADWHFKMAYTTKDKNRAIFLVCQNIDTFNLFLRTRFVPTAPSIVTDYWDEMSIKIITPGKNFYFRSGYPDIYRQPWFTKGDSLYDFVSIVNLKINKNLRHILPNNFFKRSAIELEALTDYYIKWFLQRRGIISRFQ